jgi:AbrB family looped-hinge helix DNA binding protein
MGAAMATTRLSSKGQVIIPKEFRASRHWSPGLELQIIEAEDGILLKPKAAFEPSSLEEAAGCLQREGAPRLSSEEISAAVGKGVSKAWPDPSQP